MSLYRFFLELLSEGKTVYVLAGNHDRLGNSFVFEEAKKAFDIVNSIDHDQGKIHFITQEWLTTIEGQEILFFPFMLVPNEMPPASTPHKAGLKESLSRNGGMASERETEDFIPHHIAETIKLLAASKNKNEQLSAVINGKLRKYIANKKDLMIIHHYYINNTKFPGQKSRFSYKDIALHEDIFNQPNIRLISGHLHQSFVHQNYLCLGSIRATTPLEVNQPKYLFLYTPSTQERSAKYCDIVNYMNVSETDHPLDIKDIKEQDEKNQTQQASYLTHPERNISVEKKETDLSHVNLTIKTKQLDYQEIDRYITPETRQLLQDCRLKKD